MAIKRKFRGWLWLLVLVVGLGVLGVALARPQASAAAVEVVYEQPVRAVHEPLGLSSEPVSLTAQDGAARVDLPENFYDFGSISVRDIVRRDFLVINRGSANLVLQRAYTTCACTTAELTATVIPPGKASRVTVIYNPGVHPSAGQTVRRGLVLETNDPDHPRVELWVQARVK